MYVRSSFKYTLRFLITLMNIFAINGIFIDTDKDIRTLIMKISCYILFLVVYFYFSRMILEPNKVTFGKGQFKVSYWFKEKVIPYDQIKKVGLFLHSEKTAMLIVKGPGKVIRIRKKYYRDFDALCTALEYEAVDSFDYHLSMMTAVLKLPYPYVKPVIWQEFFLDQSQFPNLLKRPIRTLACLLILFYLIFFVSKLVWLPLIFVLLTITISFLLMKKGYGQTESVFSAIRWLVKITVTFISIAYLVRNGLSGLI